MRLPQWIRNFTETPQDKLITNTNLRVCLIDDSRQRPLLWSGPWTLIDKDTNELQMLPNGRCGAYSRSQLIDFLADPNLVNEKEDWLEP